MEVSVLTLDDLINSPYGTSEILHKEAKKKETWDNIVQYAKKTFKDVSLDTDCQNINIQDWHLTITYSGVVNFWEWDRKCELSLGEIRRFLGLLASFK